MSKNSKLQLSIVIFAFIIYLSCTVAFATNTFQTSSSTIKPSTTLFHNPQPIIFSDIRLNYNQDESTNTNNNNSPQPLNAFRSLHEILTTDIETTSLHPPLSPSDDMFKPFGDQIRIEFTLATSIHNTQQILNNDELDNDISPNENYQFVLQLEDKIISLNPNQPTFTLDIDPSTTFESTSTSFTQQDPFDEYNSYPKPVSYRGERINSNGDIDVLIVAITPNDVADIDNDNNNSNLETQSDESTIPSPQISKRQKERSRRYIYHKDNDNGNNDIQPLAMDSLSGRHINGFTVQGVLLTSNGKMYQIGSYRSMMYQQSQMEHFLEQELDELQQRNHIANNIDQQEQFESLSNEYNTISTLLDTLYQQQPLSSYDLLFIEMESPLNNDSKCGVHVHDDHENHHNEDNDDITQSTPFTMSPQWSLSQWTGCHARMGKTRTIFPVKLWLSDTYKTWASNGASNTNHITAGINAMTQLIFSIMSQVTSQQMDFNFGIHSMVRNMPASFAPLNLGPACNISSTFNSFSAYLGNNPTVMDGALNHHLSQCQSYVEGTSGIAWIGQLCRKTFYASGVSGFTTLSSWTTFLHELGHNINIPHPFENGFGARGTNGGIMDYTYNRVGTGNDNDKLHYAFNNYTDQSKACGHLTAVIDGVNTNSNDHVTKDRCIRPDPTNQLTSSSKMTNYDGVLDSFEQCDPGVDNECCKGGHFISPTANCADLTNVCCQNCQQSGPRTRCPLPGENTTSQTGFCAMGRCIPNPCKYAYPDVDFESAACHEYLGSSPCAFNCPSACTGGTVNVQYVQPSPGQYCYTSTGAYGQCIANTTVGFNNNRPSDVWICQTTLSYTWKVYTHRECTASLAQIDSYICLDPQGLPVSDEYCSSATKPLPTSSVANCATTPSIINQALVNSKSSYQLNDEMSVTWLYQGSNYYRVEFVIDSVIIATTYASRESFTFILPRTTPVGTGKTLTLRIIRTDQSSLTFPISTQFAITRPPAVDIISTDPVYIAGKSSPSNTIAFTFYFQGTEATLTFELLSSPTASTSIVTTQVTTTTTTSFTAFSGTMTIPTTTLSTTTAVIRVVHLSTTVISKPFTIRRYVWVLGGYSTTCPTSTCATVTRTRQYTCQEQNGSLLSYATDSLCITYRANKPSDDVSTCTPTFTCVSANGNCVGNICQCNQNWFGQTCNIAVTVSNLILTSSRSESNDIYEINQNKPQNEQRDELTLKWSHTGSDISISIVYQPSTTDSTNRVSIVEDIDIAAGEAKFKLPPNIIVSKTAIIGIIISASTSIASSTTDFTTFTYNWVNDEDDVDTQWTECSRQICGMGYQTRRSKCQRTDTLSIVEMTLCKQSTTPIVFQSCYALTTCGTNGVCDTKNDMCTCNKGYSGQFCEIDTIKCTFDGDIENQSKCANYGYITLPTPTDECTTNTQGCTCLNSWTNTAASLPTPTITNQGCTTCSLQCNKSEITPLTNTTTGVADEICNECICGRGYWSQNCQCREFYFTLNFTRYQRQYFPTNTMVESLLPYTTNDSSTTIAPNDEALNYVTNLWLQLKSVYSQITTLNQNRFDITYWSKSNEKNQNILSITTVFRGTCADDTTLLSQSQQLQHQQQEEAQNNDSTFTIQQSSLIDYKHIDNIISTFKNGCPIADLCDLTTTNISESIYDPSCNDNDFSTTDEYSCQSGTTTSPFGIDDERSTTVDTIPTHRMTQPTSDDETTKKNNTTLIIAIVCAVVGVILIIAIIIIIVCCCDCCSSSSSSNTRKTNDEPCVMLTPMTTPPPQAPPVAPQAPPVAPRPPQQQPYTENPMLYNNNTNNYSQPPPSRPPVPQQAPNAPNAPPRPPAPQAPPAPRY